MKPNDANGHLPPGQRPFRVLLIAGSNRRQHNCPGVDSKARTLMLRLADRLPQDWELDLEDLGNVYGRARIQSCNACVSTSMALCVWPCNCYEKGDKDEPDLMWELDLYARLDLAEAFAAFVAAKGRVPPGRYRAFGHQAPGHRWADLKLAWREKRMALGHAPAGSSPAAQDERGLNRDRTLHPKRSERDRQK